MADPLDRPDDLTPEEIETLLGRGALGRWHSLAPGDRDRLSRDLEALQRTAREIADATRQLYETLPDDPLAGDLAEGEGESDEGASRDGERGQRGQRG